MNIFKRLKKWVFGIGDAVLNFTRQGLLDLANNPEVIDLAKEAVKAVEEAALAVAQGDRPKGNQKLAQAQEIIIGGLKAKGLPIVMNSINGAIWAAVADLNKDK